MLFSFSNLVANGSINSRAIAMHYFRRVACLKSAILVFSTIYVDLSEGAMQLASTRFASFAIPAIVACPSKRTTHITSVIPGMNVACAPF